MVQKYTKVTIFSQLFTKVMTLKSLKSCGCSILSFSDMGVSKNNGTPKSSILIGFSIINHPFRGTPLFGNSQIETFKKLQDMGPMVHGVFSRLV